MVSPDQLRFLFITGKGGVGKTTVAAAMGTAMARRGRRVLIAMCDAKERLSTLLGVPPISSDIVRVAPNLQAVKIVPEEAMREYGGMILNSQTVFNAVFDNRYTRAFFAAVPGLYEWAMLGKAWYHSIEEDRDGEKRFDVVLFDAPATGHGLDMLRVPKVIVDAVPPGLLRRDAERAWRMFRDPTKSGVVVVTMPEDMPTNETLELCAVLTSELGLPLVRLVVNLVIDELFDAAERAQLLEPRDLDRSRPGDEAIAVGIRRAIREKIQATSLDRLRRGVDAPMVHLPRLLVEAAAPAAIHELAGYF